MIFQYGDQSGGANVGHVMTEKNAKADFLLVRRGSRFKDFSTRSRRSSSMYDVLCPSHTSPDDVIMTGEQASPVVRPQLIRGGGR
eukprot:215848-Hanusia_phi.AAC.1